MYLNAFKEMAIMTGRVTARIGSGKGGAVRAKEGRGRISALGSLIPDFCFPDPKMRFEPTKSMVSGWFRGRSGGGRAESMRNFESGGLQWKLRIPLTVSA